MHLPISTYRIQFTPEFGFQSCRKILPYLQELGISDIYASPIFKARSGSTHGYDIVDPTSLNPELGTEQDFEHLINEVRQNGLSWMQDIVPNHMAYSSENDLLQDVLEDGQHSKYAHFFDISWQHPYSSLQNRLLAPFLGRFYGACLEDGEITLQFAPQGFSIHYYEQIYPVNIETYHSLLSRGLAEVKNTLGEDHPDFIKLLGILYLLKSLPEVSAERLAQIRFAKRMLWELYQKSQVIQNYIQKILDDLNGQPGNPESFNALDELLNQQNFRLSYWKVATEEINYRRFFSINELISLRMEDPEVLQSTHSLIKQFAKEGKFDALRIDHVDGLLDPGQYLRSLRHSLPDTYIIVEKILDLEEQLPHSWPVQGTTGYDFQHRITSLFCPGNNYQEFQEIYSRFVGTLPDYENLLSEKKRLMIGKELAGDVDNLAHQLKLVSARDRYGVDITLYGLRRALVEVLARFPVYRTYISVHGLNPEDEHYLQQAIDRAREAFPRLANEFCFIQRFLLLQGLSRLEEEERRNWLEFVLRFQQLCSPIMAKGFEDTFLYVYNRLLSLNDVGGAPEHFGQSREEFHNWIIKRAQNWPHSLNATSTHDSKRSEDVRARLNALAEFPGQWQEHLGLWQGLHRKHKTRVGKILAPDNNDEYLFYQTILGAYPFGQEEKPDFIPRIKEYVLKASREAKVHTDWINQHEAYENAFVNFVEAVLNPEEDNPFWETFMPFQEKIAFYGIFNSLVQTLIKTTVPGIPDFYQGTELWNLCLVDPDNRRPVDYSLRHKLLQDMQQDAAQDHLELLLRLWDSKEDGRIKLFLLYQALQTRKQRARLFRQGSYHPLPVQGSQKAHLFAFARQAEHSWALCLVPRFLGSVIPQGELPVGSAIWQDTHIELPDTAPATWENKLTAQEVKVKDNKLMLANVFSHFPLALLTNK